MNLIAAVDRNWAIGRNGKLLVSIPQDMAYFRQMTTGKVVIMGRKTLESFPKKKPLRNRAENIVITRQMDYQAEGATVVHSVEEALNAAARYDTRDVFVIGGGEVYRSLLPYCDTAYITRATDELTYFDLVYEFDTYRRK